VHLNHLDHLVLVQAQEVKLYMAKITNYIPEPKEDYDVDNQRQIMESLNTMKQQLNFSFQQDLKNEQDAFNYFLS